MKRRARLWLLAAAALLALAMWLSPTADPTGDTSFTEPTKFPRVPRRDDYQRMQARRTLPRQVRRSDGGEPYIVEARDPLLLALPQDADNVAVLEASAFFRLPVGQMLLECLSDDTELDKLEARGLTMDTLDRIAFASKDDEDMIILTGDFEDVQADSDAVAYGERGRLAAGSPDALLAGPRPAPTQVPYDAGVAAPGGEQPTSGSGTTSCSCSRSAVSWSSAPSIGWRDAPATPALRSPPTKPMPRSMAASAPSR